MVLVDKITILNTGAAATYERRIQNPAGKGKLLIYGMELYYDLSQVFVGANHIEFGLGTESGLSESEWDDGHLILGASETEKNAAGLNTVHLKVPLKAVPVVPIMVEGVMDLYVYVRDEQAAATLFSIWIYYDLILSTKR